MEEAAMNNGGEGGAGGGDRNSSCGSHSTSRYAASSSYDLQLGVEAGTTDDSFVPSLATVLHHLISISPPDLGEVTSFHAIKEPQISIHDYLERIAKYFGCSNECFVLSLVYIDRILKLHGDFNVSILNIHRLLITSVMLAAKFFDDVYYSNKHYARVGGVRTREINLLETQFLTLINYHLFVSPQEYDQYRRNVLAAVRYARNLPSGPSRFSSESSSSAAAAASASAGEAAQLEAPRQEQSRAADASQETGKTGDGTTTTKDPKATGSAPGPGGGGLEHGGNGASRRRVEAAHATGGHSANSSSRPRTAKSFTASWNCSSSASPDEGGSTCSGRGTDSSYTNNAVVGLRSNSHSSLGVRLGTGVSDYQHCEGKRVEEGVTTGGRASPVDPRAPVFPQRSAGSSQHCRQEDTLASAGMGSLQAVRPSGVSRSSHRRRPDLNASRGPSLRAGTAAGDEPAEVEEGVARTPKRSEKHHKKQEGSRESRGNAAVHAVEECRDHRSSPAAAEEEEMPSARRHSEFRRQKQVDDSDVEQRISYAVEAAQWSESRGEEDDAYYGRQKDGRAASVAVDEEDTWVEEETMDIAGGPAGEHRERIAFSSRHSPAHTDFPCFDYVRAPAQDQVGGKNECRCCSMPPRASVLSASSGAASSCGCEGGSDMALTRCTACGCGTGTARHVATKACGEHAGGTDAISARGPSQQSQHDLCRSRRSLADRGGFMVDRFSREAAVTVRGTGSSDAGSRTAGVVLASGSVGGGMASEAGRGQKDHQLYTAAVMAGAEVPASSSSTASGSTNGTTQSSVSSCLTPSQSIHSSPDVSMDEESGVAIAVAAGNAASSRALRGTEEDVGGANVPFFSRRVERTASSSSSACEPAPHRTRTTEFSRGGSLEERGETKQRRSWGAASGRVGQFVYAPSVSSTCPSRGGSLSFTAAAVGGTGSFPGPAAAGVPSGSYCLPYGPC